MNDEVKLAVHKFHQAWSQLQEGAQRAKDPLEKDGVIQRFEFTFELLWKTLKIFLNHKEGIICKTPKECLKAAFRLGYLNDEAVFLEMLEDRNTMSHLYNKEWAEDVFQRVKEKYVIGIKNVLDKLKI